MGTTCSSSREASHLENPADVNPLTEDSLHRGSILHTVQVSDNTLCTCSDDGSLLLSNWKCLFDPNRSQAIKSVFSFGHKKAVNTVCWYVIFLCMYCFT